MFNKNSRYFTTVNIGTSDKNKQPDNVDLWYKKDDGTTRHVQMFWVPEYNSDRELKISINAEIRRDKAKVRLSRKNTKARQALLKVLSSLHNKHW